MIDNEIIKALEQHIERTKNIKYGARKKTLVDAELLKDILDLINHQQAEIERLQESIELMKGAKCVYSYDGETLEYCTASPCPVYKTAEQIKSEAIKELLDKIEKQSIPNEDDVYWVELDDIYNLVKETVGDAE